MKCASFLVVGATVALLGFAAPANATHVSCGDTITVNTRLDSDVVCAGTGDHGLLIGADNVTLHLGGFALRSPDPGGFVGVFQADLGRTYSGVQIRGGRIEGFGSGVLIETTDSLAQRLTVTASDSGIELRGDRNSALLNDVTMTEATVGDGGGGPGIGWIGTNAYVTRNTVRGIVSFGMINISGNNSRVVVNTIACAPTSGDGLVVDNYTDAAVIALNTVTGCSSGYIVTAESPDVPGGAHVRRNVANGNGSGMNITDQAGFVWRNTANGNTNSGITSSTAGTTITENTANNNGAYGIDAAPGTIDGGGNRASGNGALTGGIQCRNVSCSP
jgi:hypothetical protein